MLADRSAALRISSRLFERRLLRIELLHCQLRVAQDHPSRLLKSCATPPARRPTDSIFWL